MVHGNTAYFSRRHNVYSYTVPGNKWTKLPLCKYEYFAMAVINDALTTIGGRDNLTLYSVYLEAHGKKSSFQCQRSECTQLLLTPW